MWRKIERKILRKRNKKSTARGLGFFFVNLYTLKKYLEKN